jgi:hypothetical protein
VAAPAQSNEIREVIPFAVIAEVFKRDSMMNLQRQFGPTIGAAIPVSLESGDALPIPVRASVIVMPSTPRWTIFSLHVSRFALPFLEAVLTTEVSRLNLGRPEIKGLAALVTPHRYARFVLGVFLSTAPMFGAVCGFTRFGAVCILESSPFPWPHQLLAAIGARTSYPSPSGVIPTGERTVFLLWVVGGPIEWLAALFAFILHYTRIISDGKDDA